MTGRPRGTRSTGPLYGRLLLISLVSISSIVVATSPLALNLFGGSADSWARRGNIGQTYGAAAALLSVLALAGVAVSLVLQARESKANREHASRLIHADLLKMAMDDPAYLECWGPYSSATDPLAQRQAMYVNLILSYWEGRYELGQLTEAPLLLQVPRSGNSLALLLPTFICGRSPPTLCALGCSRALPRKRRAGPCSVSVVRRQVWPAE